MAVTLPDSLCGSQHATYMALYATPRLWQRNVLPSDWLQQLLPEGFKTKFPGLPPKESDEGSLGYGLEVLIFKSFMVASEQTCLGTTDLTYLLSFFHICKLTLSACPACFTWVIGDKIH